MDRRRLLVTAAALVAALGVVLVVVYARGADQRAEDRFDTVDVLVATQPIAPGESVEAAEAAGKIGTGTVARGDLLDGAQTALSGIAGSVALVSIHPGEQLIAAKFGSASDAAAALPIPAGKMAVSVNLTDAARVSGFLNPGAEVAVFLNGTDQATGQPFTRLLLPRVTVLGVGSAAPAAATTAEDQGPDEPEQLPRTLLTVAVDQENAQKVLYASANGELAFALLNGESAVKPARAVTGQNLFR
jgi:pilus assembly protein CpaB